MSAGGALQTAIAAVLGEVVELSGAFDGAPARASFPYAVIDAATELDWSHKSGKGREVLAGLTIWDDQPVRLHALADEIEQRIEEIGAAEGWQLVSLRLVRRRVLRDVAGPWAAAIDFRARMLAIN